MWCSLLEDITLGTYITHMWCKVLNIWGESWICCLWVDYFDRGHFFFNPKEKEMTCVRTSCFLCNKSLAFISTFTVSVLIMFSLCCLQRSFV